MFYKLEEDGSWSVATRVDFPDGTTLSKDNKISKDGWVYHSVTPDEYIEWLNNNVDLN